MDNNDMQVSQQTSRSVLDKYSNKFSEYFDTKKALKQLKKELLEIEKNTQEYKTYSELKKKLKDIKQQIYTYKEIQTLKENILNLKNRLEILRELIKIEMLNTKQQEIEEQGIKFKIVSVLKEITDKKKQKKYIKK
ncbi:MAG: hypothetical protein NZZ41_07375 [Candidatus Dojkabacteria bacterium]|nr:hypothetical protein [Candidatus Dojkabacteria bacterium]